MLSPHIDYGRGGATYGAVWARAAAAARAAERVVIIGTDHGGPQGSITLTRQSYATPLGTLPADLETVEALAAAIGEDAAFDGELRHRDEHSIELVALWLQHMRGDRPVPTIPILVGSFDHYPRSPEAPEDDPTIRALLATLAELSANHRTLFVASGDLAHVGPAFGGEPLDAAARARLAGIDGELTTHISHADPEAFLSAIQRFENGNNVCGVSPIWLTMRAVQARQATVCAYRQCPADDEDTSWVTIAGALFDCPETSTRPAALASTRPQTSPPAPSDPPTPLAPNPSPYTVRGGWWVAECFSPVGPAPPSLARPARAPLRKTRSDPPTAPKQ